MGLSYGSTGVSLVKGSIADDKRKKHVFQSASFWRILIVIIEIGASLLLPEFTPLIGLAGASANLGVSLKFNEFSVFSTVLDFAAALIPTANTHFKDLKYLRNIEKGKEFTTDLEKGLKLSTQARTSVARKHIKLQDDIAAGLVKPPKEAKQIKDIFWKINKGTASRAEQAAYYVCLKSAGLETGEQVLNDAREILEEAARIYGTTVEALERELVEWMNLFEAVKNLKITRKITKGEFIKQLEKIGGKERVRILSSLYLKRGDRHGFLRFQKATAELLTAGTLKNVRPEIKEAFLAFFARVQHYKMSEVEIHTELNLILDGLKASDAEQFTQILNHKLFARWFEATTSYSATTNQTIRWRRIRYFGSKEFNSKWVQRIQLFDPNDLGRAPVEWTYGKLKGIIEKSLLKRFDDDLVRTVKKTAFKFTEARDAFARSGGLLLPNNSYIIGIKVLSKYVGGTALVLVKFHKQSTSAKKGKNMGGKKDVVVRMSKLDVARLLDRGPGGGVSYWFEVGKKRGWFRSKGGKRTGSSLSELRGGISLFLGFVPIAALRLVLSAVSNVVENVSNIYEHSSGKIASTWIHDYLGDLESAFVRSTINRSARLTTKVLLGGLAVNAGFGKWVGRELQRFSTVTLSLFETRDRHSGMFKWRTDFTKSGGFMSAYQRKLMTGGVMQSIRSAGIRIDKGRAKNRRHLGAKGAELVTGRRNFGQVGRIYGAFTPNAYVHSLRRITRIKRR